MKYNEIKDFCQQQNVTLVAVSKTQPIDKIKELYNSGQRIFGENRPQELISKIPLMPSDCQWHIIGNLQTNKVKSILPFVDLIHSVSSVKLFHEIDKQANSLGIYTKVLLQVHIAEEESKSGFEADELLELISDNQLIDTENVSIVGLMGMATFTDNTDQVRSEFKGLHSLFQKIKTLNRFKNFSKLSMGMSGDYKIAIEEGATMVRIGSLLFQ
jgi:pyridoxal phosphate enzyme (YggS family)